MQRELDRREFACIRFGETNRLETVLGLNPSERMPWGFDSPSLRWKASELVRTPVGSRVGTHCLEGSIPSPSATPRGTDPSRVF